MIILGNEREKQMTVFVVFAELLSPYEQSVIVFL